MPLTQAYRHVENSVVRVLALGNSNILGSGTGSVIDDGKTALTCAHCIVPGAQMAIADPGNPKQALCGQVLFSDQNADIALLQFTQQIGTPVTFADSASCGIGNGAFVVGYPMGITEQTLLSAHIASISSTHLRIDASVNHGNSGGPYSIGMAIRLVL